MPELISNSAQALLVGSMNNSSNPITFTVSSAAQFPTGGNFRVKIDNEILLVTSVSGTSFTASRAQEGTSIAAHTGGVYVYHVLTAGAMRALLSDYSSIGPLASLPAAGYAGRYYRTTDSIYEMIDNGTSWDYYAFSQKVTPPLAGDFAWVNQGTASILTANGGIHLNVPGTAAAGWRVLKKTLPSAPYSITLGFLTYWPYAQSVFNGVCLRNASSGKLLIYQWGLEALDQLTFKAAKYDSVTSYNSAYFGGTTNYAARLNPMFMKITDDGTNRSVTVGPELNTLPYRAGTSGRTDFLTADEVGFCGYAGGEEVNVKLFHYKEN